MPPHLRFACFLFMAAMIGMASLAPFYEHGIFRITSPVLMALSAGLTGLFVCRVQWTWKWMRRMAFSIALITSLFFPDERFHGAYIQAVQVVAAVQIASSCFIVWFMWKRHETRTWFFRASAKTPKTAE